jgi:hypothetical protein
LTTVDVNVRWVRQPEQTGVETQPPLHAEAAGASPNFVPRPSPSATPQVLDGLLDYQYGVPAPDANTEALACGPSASVRRPPPSATPLIMEWVQGNMDMEATPLPPANVGTWADRPSSSIRRRFPLTTPEIASNSAAQARSAPRDASRGRGTASLPPPARIRRQETGAPGTKAKITDDMLREWATLGPEGMKAAGGRGGLAWQNNVSFGTLRAYLRPDGTLSQRGEDRLNRGAKVEITNDMLRQWAALGKAGLKELGGLDGLARQNNVSVAALTSYLRADGTLTQRGEDRLSPGGKAEITNDMLRQWAVLGPVRLEAAGGVDGLARQNNVSVAALRLYLRADGTLSQHGKDRLTPYRKVEITDDMLRRWMALGSAEIEAVGGLEGLARRNNVSVASLRTYLRADGTLTPRGEDRLNPEGKVEITDDMLRQWANLGAAGIKASGGLDGLTRRHNVSIASLRTYLRADGTLTPRGENRLNPAGKRGSPTRWCDSERISVRRGFGPRTDSTAWPGGTTSLLWH